MSISYSVSIGSDDRKLKQVWKDIFALDYVEVKLDSLVMETDWRLQ
jgi:hypothetical protein